MTIEEIVKKYNPEWAILELIAKNTTDSEEQVLNILKNNVINWGELIEQAMSHKMFPVVCCFFRKEQLFAKVPPFINQYFALGYQVNQIKTREIKKQTKKIVELLHSKNISFACTKGIVLEGQLYGDLGARFLSDVDFIADPKCKPKINDLMLKMGFEVGTVDWRTNDIKKMSRQQYLMFLAEKTKLPEYVIHTNDEIIKYVSAGFVFSFTWDSCPYKVSMHDALSDITLRKLNIDNQSTLIPAMNNPYHFIYIILHLYKHAMVEHLSERRNDVNLVKFMDVYHFWENNKQDLMAKLPKIIKENNIENPIAWAAFHTDSLFGSEILKSLGLQTPDETYLYSALDKKGHPVRWKGDMRDRLFSKDRRKLFLKYVNSRRG